MIQRVLSPYVALDGTEEDLWAAAATRIPLSYKWLRRSVSVDSMDAEFGGFPEWVELRERVLPSDRICPFINNPDSLAMRQGFVVIRDGKPIGGIVTFVS
jgi:hypothetical protein